MLRFMAAPITLLLIRTVSRTVSSAILYDRFKVIFTAIIDAVFEHAQLARPCGMML